MAVYHLFNGPGWAPHLSFGGLPGGLLRNLGGILGGPITEYWGRSPQYSIISPLESPQDSPEALLEGLQSLKVGPILVIFLLTKQIRNLHMYVSTCLNIGRWWRDDGCACFCFPSARHRMLRYVSWPEAVRIVWFTELVAVLQSCNCQLLGNNGFPVNYIRSALNSFGETPFGDHSSQMYNLSEELR